MDGELTGMRTGARNIFARTGLTHSPMINQTPPGCT